MSTIAFTVCFAVWTIFAIIGVRIKQELGLNETQFGLLVGTPILTGSLVRIVLGVWTDRYGGRLVYTLTMLAAALATFLLSYAHTYAADADRRPRRRPCGRLLRRRRRLCLALLPGREAGHGARHLRCRQCRRGGDQVPGPLRAARLGLAVRWREIWAVVLAVMAVIFWFTTDDDPAFRGAASRRAAAQEPSAQEFAPLKNAQVWRFSLYYFFAFGGFVALSLWLPRYLVGVYGFDLETAGMIAACLFDPRQHLPRLWRRAVRPEGRAQRDVWHVRACPLSRR